MKEKFLIGELARLFDISTDTLRHYDRLDLLKPDYENDSQYRFYSIRSLFKLSRILFFKNLDIGLSEIRGYMRHKNRDLLLELLNKKSLELDEKIQRLTNLKHKIQAKVSLIENVDEMLSKVHLKDFPERSGVFLNLQDFGSDIELKHAFQKVERYLKTSSWLVEGQIYTSLTQEDLMGGRYTLYRYFIEVVSLQIESCPLLTVIPQGTYACMTFIGPYSQMPQHYKSLVAWIDENNYVISGASIEKNIVDYDFANSEAEYISEIQIPIIKRI